MVNGAFQRVSRYWIYVEIDGDTGLELLTPAAHSAISKFFNSPIEIKEQDFIVQYQVKVNSLWRLTS